jgi:carbonic anhydrase
MAALIIVLLLIGATITLVILNSINQKKNEQQRTQALQSTAEALDWDFEPAVQANSIAGIERLALFDLGDDNQIKNLMYAEVDGVSTTVFDYVYTVGVKRPTTFFQTVVLFEPEGQSFPEFVLRPEGAFDKMFSAFGYQDIDFDGRPEFSRQYILRGEDEPAIRRIFNDEMLSFYESNPGTFTDAGDNQLFVYRAHHRLAPEEIESYIEIGLQILSLMRAD